MATKNRPELGAVILYYVLAIGAICLFGPQVYFDFFKSKTEGIVYEIDPPVTRVKYYDKKGNEYLTATEGEYHRSELVEGDKVKVFYMENDPSDVLLPDFDGYGFPVLSMIFILMAVSVVFFMHRDYLRYR